MPNLFQKLFNRKNVRRAFGEHGTHTVFQLEFLRKNGLKPDHYFLDFGCRNLRCSMATIRYLDTGCYFGLDINSAQLAAGSLKLASKGLEDKKATLLDRSKPLDEEKLPAFDFIWIYSVFFHLYDANLFDVLKFVHAHLADDGVCYANAQIGDKNQKEGDWLEFPFLRRRFDFYQEACKTHGLSVVDIGSIKENGRDTNEAGNIQRMLKITKLASSA